VARAQVSWKPKKGQGHAKQGWIGKHLGAVSYVPRADVSPRNSGEKKKDAE
jgi:hypothetical protein